MNWYDIGIHIKHEPTGHEIKIEGYWRDSLRRLKDNAMTIIRSRVQAMPNGPKEPDNLVRTYDFTTNTIIDEKTGNIYPDVQNFLDGNIKYGQVRKSE
jgi:protein subunit release factor A